MTTPIRQPLPALLLTTLCACVANDDDETRDVHYLVTHGQYEDALELAEAAARRKPDDPRVLDEYRRASVAFLLERGRRNTFDDNDEEALEDFMQAYGIAPDLSEPRQWIARTRTKLGTRWYELAREAHTNDDLPTALQGYESALYYVPDSEEALEGMVRVITQMNYRDGLSEDYYNEGIRALRDYELYIAASRFDYSGKYRVDDKPERRVKEVEREIAKQVIARARRMEDKGFFAAARTDFRVAERLHPGNAEAVDGYARMTIEAEAHELLKKGQMWLRRGEWVKARAVLDEGRDLSAVQQERFDDAIAQIDDERVAAAYERALNLEHDFRYEEAIRGYEQLLEEREFYKDARTRMTTLEENVSAAKELYGQLEQMTDPAERLQILRQIDVLWPEYQDIPDQIDALSGGGE